MKRKMFFFEYSSLWVFEISPKYNTISVCMAILLKTCEKKTFTLVICLKTLRLCSGGCKLGVMLSGVEA